MLTARNDDCIDGSNEDSEWKEQRNKRLSLFFNFLSDPKRIIILRKLIWENGVFPDSLSEELNIARTTAFVCMRELQNLGIVEKVKIGDRHVVYRLVKGILRNKKLTFENITIDLGEL